MTNILTRIDQIEGEMLLIDGTLSQLPESLHSDLLAERLIRKIEDLQTELRDTYRKYNPQQFEIWDTQGDNKQCK